MKKELLLGLSLVLASATQAQVLMSEDFSAEQTKQPTDVGYYEFINTQDGDEREVKDGALHFYNSDAVVGQNWQRAIKFRNLPIEENTSYRVKFKLMGSNTYYSVDDDAEVRTNARFALMQGGENLDMGFLASNGEQQLNDISQFQTPDEGKGYYTYTGMFYYTNDAAQKAWYAEQNPTKDELPATYFLTLNVYNPGDFFIDDVIVEKANVGAVTFRDDVIRVNFGYAIDYQSLLKGQNRLLMPNDCVKVMLNGEQVNVLTVELLNDGSFYIFLDDMYPSGPEDDVKVSFTNPSDPAFELQYAQGRTPGGTVFNFADEAAVYDEDMPDVYSFAFVTPTLVASEPESGSFNLPLDMKEFKFTFDKNVDCSLIEARLENERLTATPAEGLSKEITFTRGAGDLVAGEYTLKLTKIYPEVMLAEDIFGEENITLTFGKVNVDPNDTVRVVMTDGFEAAGAGAYPEKWSVMSDNVLKSTADDGWGSGSRLMGGFSGAFTVGMYLCGRNGSESYAFYGAGTDEAGKFHLGAGKHQLSFNAAVWDNATATRAVKVQVCDELNRVLVEQESTLDTHLDNSLKDASNINKVEVNFRAENEGNYVLKFWGLSAPGGSNGGWGDAILFGNVQVKYLPAAAGVEETNMLLAALAEAKATLESNVDERYAGADYDNLKAIIEAYEGKEQVFTAPSQFRNATAELQAAATAMKNHRSLCDTYDPLVDEAKYARDLRIGTKFERHESFAAIEAAIAKYEGRVLTDNAELTEAIDVLKTTTATVTNIGRVVETYLASMTTGLATLEKLGAADEALTAEVNDLLTDDPAVKSKLQHAILMAIYEKLADPANDMFSPKVDEVTLEEFVDTFDVSVFINNPEIYYTGWDDKAPAGKTKAVPSTENVPGWTITTGEGWAGGYDFHYPWGAAAQYVYNERTCPVANGMIASWGFSYRIEQTIENLPAGTYRLYVGTGERGGNETPTSYIFANDQQVVIPVIAGSVEPADNAVIDNIVVTDGKLTVGLNQDQTDHTFFNCMHLYLVGAAEGFNYAQAYTDGIEEVSSNAAVRRTECFDLNGRRVNDAQRGVVIIRKTMTDGRTVTEKVVK